MGKSKRAPEHYVNNRDFTKAVTDYVYTLRSYENEDTQQEQQVPDIPPYIGQCFMRIAEGLSTKPNFMSYSYREEMVMDGVENCVRAVGKYNPEASTRSGQPNAFAYFTQICYFAFIRRINREQRQQDIRDKVLEEADYDAYVDIGDQPSSFGSSIMERIRQRDPTREEDYSYDDQES